ncbi:hypothetical protein M0813_23302 [Anaeramoeba flamelloides]|uniref:Uncharacterized protein n=1 Tax=Anaeramoeba flamelloides TaxID=1746091 RepID=A0ABQ8YAW8_9EUKA|nr:hypothetical protein M0813_23302 [Anaeramoeba flamelloides]
MSLSKPQQEIIISENINNPNINYLTKKRGTSEMNTDHKIIKKIQMITQEKIEKQCNLKINEIREKYDVKEKIYKEEISQLKEQLSYRINALENSNTLRDEIVFEKRKLILINKKLRDQMTIIKSRNLFLELQNTKLKNQMKRRSQQVRKYIVKEINSTTILNSNLNKNKNKNKNKNENQNTTENCNQKKKIKKKKNHIRSKSYYFVKFDSNSDTMTKLDDKDNKKIKGKTITQNKRKKRKKKRKNKNWKKEQEIGFKKNTNLTRNNSFVKTKKEDEKTEISIESLGNNMEILIRNDLGMKKSWSIADMDLRESQQKIQENLWIKK